MGQKDFIIGIMAVGLFTIAIIGFAINFSIDNNSVIKITDDPDITNLNLVTQNNISNMRDISQESYTSIVKSSIDQGFNIESGGSLSLTITNAVPTMFNILKIGYTKIFGTGQGFSIFMTGFITIITFLGFMYFAKMWLGRNPD